MDTPLTQREFDTWRQEDHAFKSELRGFMTTQTTINLDVEGRVSTVEAKQEDCEETTNRRATWVSAVVSAVIGALATAVGWVFAKQ